MQFRIFGVPVLVGTPFWLTALLFGALSGTASRSWLVVVATVAVVFVAVLVHELGHALTARAFGAEVFVVLHAFGGRTHFRGPPFGRLKSLVTHAAGPGAGIALGIATVLLSRAFPPAGLVGAKTREMLLICTFFWSAINLLPVLPFDGGLILQDVLGPKRQRLTLWLSALCGVLVCAAAMRVGWPWIVLFFGMATYRSAKEAWTYGERQQELLAREQAVTQALERARAAADRGSLGEAERVANEALAMAPTTGARDEARRVLAAAALERGDGFKALSQLGALEEASGGDDVLRAQALDALGEREAAFALLERRVSAEPEGPALDALLTGLLATGQLDRAAQLGEALATRAPVETLSRLSGELLDRGSFGPAAMLSLALHQRTGEGAHAFAAARAMARKGDPQGALDALERAVASGFADADRVKAEGDLSSLHHEPRFERVLAHLGAA